MKLVYILKDGKRITTMDNEVAEIIITTTDGTPSIEAHTVDGVTTINIRKE